MNEVLYGTRFALRSQLTNNDWFCLFSNSSALRIAHSSRVSLIRPVAMVMLRLIETGLFQGAAGSAKSRVQVFDGL